MNYNVDYYWILGLSPDTATQDDIKSNYRKLVKRWHPDVNRNDPNASKMFQSITEAYEVLSDPQRKVEYDEHRHPYTHETIDKSPFVDLFGRDDNVKLNPTIPRDGKDIYITTTISFVESMRGADRKKVKMQRQIDCPKCHGFGSLKGLSGVGLCKRCSGKGIINEMHSGIFHSGNCDACEGRGYLFIDKCPICDGYGRVIIDDETEIDIPRGINTGSMLRVSGMGHAGHLSGNSGDLYVNVSVEEHPIYHREGQNLFMKLAVPFETMILGGEIEIPLPLGGHEKKTIPAYRNNKYSVIVSGKGVPFTGLYKRGNLIVSLESELPSSLTEKEKEILEAYSNERRKSKRDSSESGESGTNNSGTSSDKARSEQGQKEADTVQ